MKPSFLGRQLPAGLEGLDDLALDLRWTWSHEADDLWRWLDPAAWERAENPWTLLQDLSRDRLRELANDPERMGQLQRLVKARSHYLDDPGWYGRGHPEGPRRIAYFSMEFGLGEALPLYAGGLGVLAGDYLKGASDLGVPVVGVGLLYQQGYFRQLIDAAGEQVETYPYNDPTTLPITPMMSPRGGWLHVQLPLPGRTLFLRVWRACIGRVPLLLLDSNDPLNSPTDRAIVSQLYGTSRETRLLQYIILGVGGWQALLALDLEPEILHLNEGHAGLAALERARCAMEPNGLSFMEALWATRAGNVFTTHTAIRAAMDTFDPEFAQQFAPYFQPFLAAAEVELSEILALGRSNPADPQEPFNMTYLALRCSGVVSAVSRLHKGVSRQLFQVLYPGWPTPEVPVTHVTNGVHMPSWDSPQSDAIWEEACGKERWREVLEGVPEAVDRIPDAQLWAMRAAARRTLVEYTRRRLGQQLGSRGAPAQELVAARHVLDPNILTLGFARRFTEYKRPDLLLRDRERLTRLLADPTQPIQLIVAGKAHPADAWGKNAVARWVALAREGKLRNRVVFLEDYDLTVAQELVRGVDVWLNTPRRPWEACGTSGMKVLVNGGLNLSSRDGWWEEAYVPEVGWALGDERDDHPPDDDAADMAQLFDLLEHQVVPEFYLRDAEGIPRAWVARLRASMAHLAPHYSANRMVREYVDSLYASAAELFRRRSSDGGAIACALQSWEYDLRERWSTVHFGNVEVLAGESPPAVTAQVYLGEIEPAAVAVELYADARDDHEVERIAMARIGDLAGAMNGGIYRAELPGHRPAEQYTARVVPYHGDAHVPGELPLILWQR